MFRPSTRPNMKLTLKHRNHSPSKSIVEMIEGELKAIESDLQIDEARVQLERSLTESPPFSVSFHLVTPGPDVIVKATDHTLRAAILKAFERIAGKIGHRRSKRIQRQVNDHITASPRRLANS
jgi:ribosome-associated translation inhibitor RaiA